MLFSIQDLLPYLNSQTVTGVIHVGAHMCEEANYYHNILRLSLNNIFWVEGNPETCNIIKSRFKNFNIYEGVCTDKTGDKLSFTITKKQGKSIQIIPSYILIIIDVTYPEISMMQI